VSIAIANLSYSVEGASLLREINLEVAQGSIAAIVGPNGSGKTSLLKVVSREVDAQHGKVEINGHDVGTLTLAERAQRFGVLPQEANLDFPFTVEEVVQMGRIPHLTTMRENIAIVNEILAEMELESIRYRIYPTLSGGEKQRVQIGRVLSQIWGNREQACLFLDEPTSALDLAHQIALLKTLRQIAKLGSTVMIVLHDINLALRFAEHVVLLFDGRVLSSGTPLEVFSTDNMKTAFQVDIDIFTTDDPKRPFLIARD
jgi:iron complex transport system ATP-binding protein